MTQGKFEILDEIEDGHEQAELARALGIAREDFDESLPIQVITTGLSCLAVPVRSLADLRDMSRQFTSLLAEIYTRHGATGCHAFTRETLRWARRGRTRVSLRLRTTFRKIRRPEVRAARSAVT